jgi:hypothetical protein
MTKICGGPHKLPDKAKSWLPKFSSNDDITCNHLTRFYKSFELHEVINRNSDVIMKLFSTSLIGDVRMWYNNLPSKSIRIWEDLENTFIKRWGNERDPIFLFSQYNEIHKYKEESIREFNDRFNTLLNQIPSNLFPKIVALN